jgi:hypothetical protein
MPTTTVEKKPPVSPARAELAATIVRKREAAAVVGKHQEAIARADDLIRQCDTELEKAEATRAQKHREDVRRAATAIENDDTKELSAGTGESMRRTIEATQERRQLAVQAKDQLKVDLVKSEIAAALAANDVVIARAKLLAPVIAGTVARVKASRLEILKDRVLLATLLADQDAPEFPHDSQAFFKAREAEQARIKARQMACGEFRAEAEADAAYLSLMPTSNTYDEYTLVLGVAEQLKRKLARLLDDPTAELPEI